MHETVRLVARLALSTTRELLAAAFAEVWREDPQPGFPPVPQPVAGESDACRELADIYEVRLPAEVAVRIVGWFNAVTENRYQDDVEVQTDPVVGLQSEVVVGEICSHLKPNKPPRDGNDTVVLQAPIYGQAQPGCCPAPSFHRQQRYLGPASQRRFGGVNAAAAWSLDGGTGKDIKIADIELAWEDHPDLLPAHEGSRPSGTPGAQAHGLAVEGILAAIHNGEYVDGLAPGATVLHYAVADYSPANVAHALCTSLGDLEAGDVVLLETQYQRVTEDSKAGCCYSPFLSHETALDTFRAIEAAIRRNVHVVLAAGNGGIDLCSYLAKGKDSGAIVVGGGQPSSGMRTLESNWGERVDLFAWGNSVATLGVHGICHDLWSAPQCSVGYFHGTSPAAAIVAGVVAVLSGILKHRGACKTPAEMRDLLVRCGYKKHLTNTSEIGVHPDLRAACLELEKEGILEPGSVV